MGLIKNKDEIAIMEKGGKILFKILKSLKKMIKPGLDVMELEKEFLRLCKAENAIPACLNYRTGDLPPFPTGLCISINEQAVHCYPHEGSILKAGDTVAVDTVISYRGMHVDSAFTIGVGDLDSETQRFLAIAQMALSAAIKQAIPGNHVGDISYAMQTVMQLAGFDVIRDFVGHGIGSRMHEQPDIPCFGKKGQGPVLYEGMTIAIEALTCKGSPEIDYPGPDAWQTRLSDLNNFAIFEHTVLITDKEPQILTR